MRLIDADLLKKSIDANRFDSDTDYLECLYQIDIAPTAQRWIQSSERLPEEEHNGYLVTSKCYDESDVFLEVYADGEFGFWDGDNLIGDKFVIAWMPLPEPYKEVQDEVN